MQKKKTILLLGAGHEQVIAINEAKSLGYIVVACDENTSAPGLQLAHVGLTLNIRDVDALIQVGLKHNIDGIFCHAVEIPHIVAKVAKALNLNGLSPHIAELCTHKQQRIAALETAHIPVASHAFADSKASLIEAAKSLGYPLVIKPTNTAGSRGVQLVISEESLLSAYEEAMQYTASSIVVLEQYLTGPQVSTESVVHDGVVHTFALADRNYAQSDIFYPYFIEDGINYPSSLPATIQHKILDLVTQTINALGIDFGAAKGDIIIHNGEPHIIEMASRTSGGWFGAGSIPIATGINALKPLLQMSVGDTPDLDALIPTRQLYCAQRYWIPKHQAIFQSAHGFESVKVMPGVEMFNTFFPPTGTPISKARHHAQRYAQVICSGDSRQDAMYRAQAAIDAIQVKLNPI